MSLDVYLTVKKPVVKSGTGVYARENGQRVELTAKEVAEKFEGAEIQPTEYESNEVFDYNITHNLGSMADKAGIYYYLWRPEERQCYKAKDLILPLSRGLKKLKDSPDKFKELNPDSIKAIGRLDSLNLLFHEGVTAVVIDKGKSVCLVVGNAKYYFNPAIKEEDYTGMDNETHNRIVLKYDGWERTL